MAGIGPIANAACDGSFQLALSVLFSACTILADWEIPVIALLQHIWNLGANQEKIPLPQCTVLPFARQLCGDHSVKVAPQSSNQRSHSDFILILVHGRRNWLSVLVLSQFGPNYLYPEGPSQNKFKVGGQELASACVCVCASFWFCVLFVRGSFEELFPSAFSSVCRIFYDPVILRVNSLRKLHYTFWQGGLAQRKELPRFYFKVGYHTD